MSLPKQMYEPVPYSPVTLISAAIGAGDTTITVDDGALLGDAPNIAVIGGTADVSETIIYGTKNGNILSNVQRGVQGTAKGWSIGDPIARNFTALDQSNIQDNINALNTILSISNGNWTPLPVNADFNFTDVFISNYQKFGPFVYICLYLNIVKNSNNVASTNFIIEGLPFTSAIYGVITIGYKNTSFGQAFGASQFLVAGTALALVGPNGGYIQTNQFVVGTSYSCVTAGFYKIS